MSRVCFRPTAAMSNGASPPIIVAIAGDLFFPRSAELGLSPDDTVSVRVLEKMVFAGVQSGSHQAASKVLEHVGDLSVSPERIRRACQRVGQERIEHHQQQQKTHQSKPLLDQAYKKPAGAQAIDIACVMCDGGRYQLLDRADRTPEPRSARKGDHWKESRIGVLLTMTSEQHDHDPQPVLPPELRYQAMAVTLAEIGKTGAKLDEPDEDPQAPDAPRDGLAGAKLVSRDLVASRCDWETFGPLLASQAWYRGFAAAKRKVFLSDGSATIEKLQGAHFSHFTSILDLLHALSYSLAAARAVCSDETAARGQYNSWAALIWEGRVTEVIKELLTWQEILGDPPAEASSTDPREVVRTSRVYYENHLSRMNYPAYRQAGFPLTSSLMESAVKQVSRRVKGTEKFWSTPGAEAMLRLRAEYLSDSAHMPRYWNRRRQHATTGLRNYRPKTTYLCT